MGYEKKEIEEKIIDAGANKLYASEIVNYKGYFKGVIYSSLYITLLNLNLVQMLFHSL